MLCWKGFLKDLPIIVMIFGMGQWAGVCGQLQADGGGLGNRLNVGTRLHRAPRPLYNAYNLSKYKSN